MPSRFRTALVLSALSAVMAAPLAAQVTQTGIIAGAVTDSEGEPVIAARVTVFSASLLVSKVVTLTDGEGEFRIPGLPPGVYRIEVEAEDFRKSTVTDVLLRVGDVRSALITMLKDGEGAPPEAGIRLPPFEYKESGIIWTLEPPLTERLPLPSEYADAAALIPGIVRIGEGYSAKGASVRENSYLINRASAVDPATGTRPVGVALVSLESIRTKAAGFYADSGGAAGSQVNLISLKGERPFNAVATFFFRDDSMNGSNDSSGRKELEEEYRPSIFLSGRTAGGLDWFNIAYSSVWRNSSHPLGRLAPARSTGYDFSVEASARLSPRLRTRGMLLRSSLERSRHFCPNLNLWTVLETDPDRVCSDRGEEAELMLLGFEYRLSDTIMLSFEAGRLAIDEEVLPTSGNTQQRTEIDPTGHVLYEGSFLDSWSRRQTERYMLSAGIDYYLDELAGTHDIDLGLEYEGSDSRRTFGLNGLNNIIVYRGERLSRSFLRTADGEAGSVRSATTVSRFSVFGQDCWSPMSNLAVFFGVRYDGPIGQNSYGRIIDWDDVSPRLGFTIDPLGNGRSIISAGFSRYFQAARNDFIPPDPYAVVLQFRHLTIAELGFLDEEGIRQWGTPFDAVTNYGYAPGWSEVDLNTTAPYVDEFHFGGQYEPAPNLVVSAHATYRKWRNLLEDVERNLWDYYGIARTIDSLGEEYSYWRRGPGADGTYNPRFYWTNDQRLERSYLGIELAGVAELPGGAGIRAHYLLSRAEGNLDVGLEDSSTFSESQNYPARFFNSSGYLSCHRRHDLLVTAYGTLPLGISFGALFRYRTGAPYDRTALNPDLYSLSYEIRRQPRGTAYGNDRLLQADIRLEKGLSVGRSRVSFILDVYNLLNDGAVIERYGFDDERFGEPLARTPPRTLQVGFRYTF